MIDPRKLAGIRCPHCDETSKRKSGGEVVFEVYHPDKVYCRECGTAFSEENYPTSGKDTFDGMEFEYHRRKDGKKIMWKPQVRHLKSLYAFYAANALARKAASSRAPDPLLGRKVLDVMLAYGEYYEKYICSGTVGKIHRPGYPLPCNWGRICHFGDYVFPSIVCEMFQNVVKSGVTISEEERARCRGLLEVILSELTLPFIRQSQGMGNPMGAAFTDCIRVARIFPEARIIDYYTPDSAGKPVVLCGADLIHEVIEGRHGLNNLIVNYWYPDGLMREPTVAYQSMLVGGIKAVFTAIDGYSDPESYRAAEHGDYTPFVALSNLQNRPEYKPCLTRHLDVNFPDGLAIPCGDAVSKSYGVKTPQTKSDLYHGWGLGVLRSSASCAVVNWGNREGHSHNDMLALMFWGNKLLMLNTTEYPASFSGMRAYWRMAAAAHNTVVIDGVEHTLGRGNPALWAPTGHASIMQGFSDRTYSGCVLRRTVFLVESRRDGTPYLIDFFHVNGGKEYHDYFLQAQSAAEAPVESLETASIELRPSDKKDDLSLLFNSGSKAGYSYIMNPIQGRFVGNAELWWTFENDNEKLFLHGTLVPESDGEILAIGDAPGVRQNEALRTRRVRKVAWRRPVADRKDISSCFTAVFEHAHSKTDCNLTGARRLPVSGNASTAALVVHHDDGSDIAIVSTNSGRAVIKTDVGDIIFDGSAALFSLDKNGEPRHLTTTGVSEFKLNGKVFTSGGTIIGKLAAFPSGLAPTLAEEKKGTIIVDAKIPENLSGSMIFIQGVGGYTSSYRIESVRTVPGGTELGLDRSVRKLILVGKVEPDSKSLKVISGGLNSLNQGDLCLIGGHTAQVKSIVNTRHSFQVIPETGITFEKPVPARYVGREMRFPVTELGQGCSFILPVTTSEDFE